MAVGESKGGMFSKFRMLGGQTVIYGLGDTLYKLVAFVLVPVYLRYLLPEQYGVLETLTVTGSLAVTLVTMGLPNAILRFYYKTRDEYEKIRLVSSVFFLAVAAQIIILLVLLWQYEWFAKLILAHTEYGFLFAILSVNIFLASFRQIPLVLFRAQNRPLGYTAINMTVALVTLTANVFFVAYGGKGVLGVMLGNLCGASIGILLIVPMIIREIRLVFDITLVKKITSFAIPMSIAALLDTVIFLADRYFLVRLTTLHDVGIYALAYKLASIVKVFIVMPFMLAWSPFVFSHEREDNAREIYSRMATYFILIGILTVLVLSVFADPVIAAMSGNGEYAASGRVVPILCYAFLLHGATLVLNTGIKISGKTFYTTAVFGVGLCTNLSLNYVLIKTFGYEGAAYSLVITFLVTAWVSHRFAKKEYKIDYEFKKIAVALLSSIVIIAIAKNFITGSGYHANLSRMALIAAFVLFMYNTLFTRAEKERIRKILAFWSSRADSRTRND